MARSCRLIGRVVHGLVGLVVAVSVVACQTTQAPPAPPVAPTLAPAPAATTQQQAAPTAAASQPATTASQAPAAQTESVRVGFLGPLTGAIARLGITSDRLMRMAIEDINAKGGVRVGGKTYRMDVVESADSKFTSEGGRQAADRLVLSDKLKFVLGGFSNDTAGSQAITEPQNVLNLSYAALDASLGPKFPLTLQPGIPHSRMRIAAVYQWLARANPNAKRVVIAQNEDALGQAYVAMAKEYTKEFGSEVVAAELWPIDLKDFGPVAMRIMRLNPDAVDIPFTTAAGPLLQALRGLGFKGIVLTQSVSSLSTLKQQVGLFEGLIGATLADAQAPVLGVQVKSVLQRFIQKYGEADLELVSIPAYNIPFVLAQAVEQAGTIDDTSKIAQTMRAGEWNTMFGKGRFVGEKTFGLPAVIEQPIFMTKVEGGKIITFDQIKGTMP